jgi:hypothetical protein
VGTKEIPRIRDKDDDCSRTRGDCFEESASDLLDKDLTRSLRYCTADEEGMGSVDERTHLQLNGQCQVEVVERSTYEDENIWLLLPHNFQQSFEWCVLEVRVDSEWT